MRLVSKFITLSYDTASGQEKMEIPEFVFVAKLTNDLVSGSLWS